MADNSKMCLTVRNTLQRAFLFLNGSPVFICKRYMQDIKFPTNRRSCGGKLTMVNILTLFTYYNDFFFQLETFLLVF